MTRPKEEAYAWPGGYPIVYIADDGGVLCANCASGENGSDAAWDAEPGSGWRIVAKDIHWEGPPEFCANCGNEIESAYGDPDAEEVTP